jgi:hypothetical protein
MRELEGEIFDLPARSDIMHRVVVFQRAGWREVRSTRAKKGPAMRISGALPNLIPFYFFTRVVFRPISRVTPKPKTVARCAVVAGKRPSP